MWSTQYFVVVFVEIATLLIGFYLGVFYLQQRNLIVLKSKNPIFLYPKGKSENKGSGDLSNSNYLTILNRLNLFELEIRVLSRLLSNGCISVAEFNELIKLTHMSKENQRQRRHLFIKELNLKLSVINGVKENIARIDDQQDKRSKIYCFDESFDKNMLGTYLTS